MFVNFIDTYCSQQEGHYRLHEEGTHIQDALRHCTYKLRLCHMARMDLYFNVYEAENQII